MTVAGGSDLMRSMFPPSLCSRIGTADALSITLPFHTTGSVSPPTCGPAASGSAAAPASMCEDQRSSGGAASLCEDRV